MTNRTALLTAGSIVAVVLSAIAALALNVGIFDRASSSDVGQLTAGDLGPAATSDTAADPGSTTAGTTSNDPEVPQLIDVAGIATVSVSTTTGSATDQLSIDGIDAEPGWDWEIARRAPDAVEIHLTDGTQTQIVTLTSTAGQVSARLRAGDPAPAAPPSNADDEHDDDEDDDDEHEEHEGGEDDD